MPKYPSQFLALYPELAANAHKPYEQSQLAKLWNQQEVDRVEQTKIAEGIAISDKLTKPVLQQELAMERALGIQLAGKVAGLDKQIADLKALKHSMKTYSDVILSGELTGREQMAVGLLQKGLSAPDVLDILKETPRADNDLKSAQIKAIEALAQMSADVPAAINEDHNSEDSGLNSSHAVEAARALGKAKREMHR